MNTCRPPIESKTNNDGFAISEVLVTIIIVSIMSALMMAMTGQFRLLLEVDRRIEVRTVLINTVKHVARVVAAAERLPLLQTGGDAVALLEGTRNSVRFVAVAQRGQSSGGLAEISFYATGESGAQRLQQLIRPRRTSPPEGSIQVIDVANNLGLFELSYFGRLNGEERAGWHNRWVSPKQLPIAIRITLVSADEPQPIRVSEIAKLNLSD